MKNVYQTFKVYKVKITKQKQAGRRTSERKRDRERERQTDRQT